jgi:septum site-determining protein MinC
MSLDWDEPFPSLLNQLESHLKETDNFFEGSKVILEIGAKDVGLADLQNLQRVLTRHGMQLWGVKSSAMDENYNGARATREPSVVTPRADDGKTAGYDARRHRLQAASTATADDKNQPKAVIIKRTLRSGQIVNFPGSVILIGDVNPGAEVVSGHDIVIWGSLKGTACAGASGNPEAAIFALQMAPSQLRIADHLSRSPKENPVLSDGHDLAPEVAHIEGDEIVVERWNLRKTRT